MSGGLPRPLAEWLGTTLRFAWDSLGLRVDVDRFVESKDGLHAELLIASVDGEQARLLHASRLNLLSVQSRGTLARALGTTLGGVPWPELLEQVCFLAVERHREGEPTVDLRAVDPYERPRWVLKPYLEHGGPTVLFAPGGCVAPDTLIDGPDGARRIDALAAAGEPIRVWSLGPTGPVAAWSLAPFRKGHAPLYRFDTEDGHSVTVTGRHRFLTPQGWRFASALRVGDALAVSSPDAPATSAGASSASLHPTNAAAGPCASVASDGRSLQTLEDWTARYWPGSHQCDGPTRWEAGTDLAAAPLLGGALAHSQTGCDADDRSALAAHSRIYRLSDRHSRSNSGPVALCGGSQSLVRAASWRCVSLPESTQGIARSLSACGPLQQGAVLQLSARQEGAFLSAPSVPHSSSLTYSTISARHYVGAGDYYDLHVPGFENYLAHGIWHHNSGKTYLAAAMALSIAAGCALLGAPQGQPAPVLYLDWEADRYVHAERLNALGAGIGLRQPPAVYYRRMATPLADSVAPLLREIARLQIGAGVIDSLGPACGGDLESADTILRCFAGMRALGVPCLVVSHVTKADLRSDGAARHRLSPFGSVYTENAARNTWSVHRAGEEGSDAFDVALVHEKTNNGRYQKRHAYHLEFVNAGEEEDEHLVSLEMRPVDLAQVPEFEQRLPLRERVLAQLRSGALTAKTLSETLSADDAQVRARLKELREAGMVVVLPDRRFGLAMGAGR